MPAAEKHFTIVAGPNGSGKTTFVQNIFPEFLENAHFLNADIFAKELCPDNVRKVAILAGKKFLKAVDYLIDGEESFIIETTLSGKGLLKKVNRAKERGFSIRFIFL